MRLGYHLSKPLADWMRCNPIDTGPLTPLLVKTSRIAFGPVKGILWLHCVARPYFSAR